MTGLQWAINMSVNEIHEQIDTIKVDVFIPGHEKRATTSLFAHTRKQLVAREKGRCYVCGRDETTSGNPLEAHHHPIERAFANMIDWSLLQKQCQEGIWGEHAKAFDWSTFDENNPYSFVDNMLVNGLLLCKAHHTGPNQGIHDLPYPVWLAQKMGKEGYQFSKEEIIHHEG